MINSRQKGAGGEREFARLVGKRFNVAARRGQQFAGSEESPDVVTELDSLFHFEVKRVENLRLLPALDQAKGDCGELAIPVVAWRKNRKPWVAILDMEDFFDLVDMARRAVAQAGSDEPRE